MFCPNCGNKEEDSQLYCSKCGSRLPARSETTARNTATGVNVQGFNTRPTTQSYYAQPAKRSSGENAAKSPWFYLGFGALGIVLEIVMDQIGYLYFFVIIFPVVSIIGGLTMKSIPLKVCSILLGILGIVFYLILLRGVF